MAPNREEEMMKRCLVFFTILMLLMVTGVFGAEDEVLKLKNRIIEIQNKGQLGFQGLTFCSKILGFGSYVPLKEPIIDKDGKLLVYYEPRNVYTNKRDDLYEIWYTQDLALLNEKGEVLQEWNGFLDFHYMSKKPVLDMFAQNSLNLQGSGLPPGKYKVGLTLNDKLRGASVTHVAEFQVR